MSERKSLNQEAEDEGEVKLTSKKIARMFDTYYHMGEDRDLRVFARRQHVSLETVMEIYQAYGWATKIKEMDDIKEREFEDWFKSRSKGIRQKLTNQLSELLEGMESSSLGLPLAINNVQDLKTVSAAYAELVKATDTILRRPQQMEDSSQPTTWSDLLDEVGKSKGSL